MFKCEYKIDELQQELIKVLTVNDLPSLTIDIAANTILNFTFGLFKPLADKLDYTLANLIKDNQPIPVEVIARLSVNTSPVRAPDLFPQFVYDLHRLTYFLHALNERLLKVKTPNLIAAGTCRLLLSWDTSYAKLTYVEVRPDESADRS